MHELASELNIQWVSWLNSPRRFVAVSHLNPDGDAIGSSLGLKHLLEPMGHTVAVIMPSQSPHYMNWAPGFESILHADSDYESCCEWIAQADGIFCLDFGVLNRTKNLEDPIRQAKGIKINIDHHIDCEPFAQYNYRDVTASSTCELIYRLVRELQPTTSGSISKACATCLYAGLSTDTGSFRHRNTDAPTLRTAADLIEMGAEVEYINYGLYSRQSESRLRLTGFCLLERLSILSDLHTAYIKILAEDYDRFQVQPGDTEGLVNMALSVEGVNLGILMVERPDAVRMSFRSVGSFSANELAAQFGGGGHYNAAGARSLDSLEATEIKLLSLLQQYQSQLDYQPY